MTFAQIYSRIPSANCKGLCAESCGPIPVFPHEPILAVTEEKFIERNTLKNIEVMIFDGSKQSCPHLVEGRCSQYEVRPAICRMFGAALGMVCGYGCVPDRWMNFEEGHQLLKQVEKAEVT